MNAKKPVIINVGGNRIGIVGMDSAFSEVAESFSGEDDRVIVEELLSRLSRDNYFPDSAREKYGKAFLREFKKNQGFPVEDDGDGELLIRVLGQGCGQCETLMAKLMEALSELNLPADLAHVKDIREISKYGVMGMPALVINGKILLSGKIPSGKQIKDILEEYKK